MGRVSSNVPTALFDVVLISSLIPTVTILFQQNTEQKEIKYTNHHFVNQVMKFATKFHAKCVTQSIIDLSHIPNSTLMFIGSIAFTVCGRRFDGGIIQSSNGHIFRNILLSVTILYYSFMYFSLLHLAKAVKSLTMRIYERLLGTTKFNVH
ncbi:hypothetical protein FF38_08507 [Lucilia cuprina]|uniref:Uncharacterized protein n=1 Tax=Lucilia cuprina TaxID=7375 RepID=A0A0L0CBZ8_LUCCU|nr:hypothetical protein FF38_08507 [Lucilia cuprina]